MIPCEKYGESTLKTAFGSSLSQGAGGNSADCSNNYPSFQLLKYYASSRGAELHVVAIFNLNNKKTPLL
jgi:hypothetical protein